MDKGTEKVDKSTLSRSQPGPSPKAIFVLGTPISRDMVGRMELGIELLESNYGGVIVALGTRQESWQMMEVGNKDSLSHEKIVLDDNSRTTIDNAYYAKKICQRRNLTPGILVTSQYQSSRAMLTFRRVFGPGFSVRLYPSLSLTSSIRRLRETVARMSVPMLFLFRNGDDEALKRASDLIWRLVVRR